MEACVVDVPTSDRLSPNDTWALMASPICAVLVIAGLMRHHAVKTPTTIASEPVSDNRDDLSALVMEAKREV